MRRFARASSTFLTGKQRADSFIRLALCLQCIRPTNGEAIRFARIRWKNVTASVNPRLTDTEILDRLRVGSVGLRRSEAEVLAKGLLVVPIPGAGPLPPRLREAHVEIRPGPVMTRALFKQALKELE